VLGAGATEFGLFAVYASVEEALFDAAGWDLALPPHLQTRKDSSVVKRMVKDLP
jgi:hypothetical protein